MEMDQARIERVLIPSSSGQESEPSGNVARVVMDEVLIPSSSGQESEHGYPRDGGASLRGLNPFFIRARVRTDHLHAHDARRAVLIPSSSGQESERSRRPRPRPHCGRLNPFFIRARVRTPACGSLDGARHRVLIPSSSGQESELRIFTHRGATTLS